MTAIPHTDLPAFFEGFPVVIKTTPTFQPGASISSLAGVTLTAKITDGQVDVMGTVTVTGGEVTMAFPALSVTAGSWRGILSYPDSPMATFAFVVEAAF